MNVTFLSILTFVIAELLKALALMAVTGSPEINSGIYTDPFAVFPVKTSRWFPSTISYVISP